ncbi:hypothetical protein A8144_07835 [Mycobacterium leprae 3125609]|nr:glycerophosphodiester phosphodiesterase family protein [Mycobacterium leprae]OAR21058.1 hypothetical protein A8144_07835 [Mycobacterium leprae 3125609]OAX71231.1 hypothetical protein A3216_07065 [Mycobacterium leprae 7935681]
MILHDPRLESATGVPGTVYQLYWRDFHKTDLIAGETIPTLEELLVTLPDMRANIDIKAASAINPAVNVIELMYARFRY